jgi:hypothetical protein
MKKTIENQALLALISSELKERVREALRTELSDALYCSRVWSAWGYGTMREDDFIPVPENGLLYKHMLKAQSIMEQWHEK